MEQNFWEERYETGQTGWTIGDVSTPIKVYLDQLESKDLRILIPGCGYGYEAMYAHALGFKQVHVLDFVSGPLQKLREAQPDFPPDHIHLEDFFRHSGEYDVIIEQTLFCAIDPSMRERYAEKSAQLLRPGGKLVGVLFDRAFEGGPPFGGSAAEYRTLFERYFSRVEIAPCYNSIPPRKGTEVFAKLVK